MPIQQFINCIQILIKFGSHGSVRLAGVTKVTAPVLLLESLSSLDSSSCRSAFIFETDGRPFLAQRGMAESSAATVQSQTEVQSQVQGTGRTKHLIQFSIQLAGNRCKPGQMGLNVAKPKEMGNSDPFVPSFKSTE